jgi:hypothetical protein
VPVWVAVIIGYLIDILGASAAAAAALRFISQALGNVAREHTPYAVETIAANGTNTVIHPTWGNHALLTAIQAISPPSGPTIQDVLDAIAALPAGSAFPPIPSGAENAAAVWAYQVPTQSTLYTGTLLNYAGLTAFNSGQMHAWRLPESPFFTFSGWLWDHTMPLPDHGYPTGDWSDIQAADTRLTWLQRTESAYDWVEATYNGTIDADYPPAGPTKGTVKFILTEPEFQALKPSTLLVPPIYPGSAGVTNGTPVVVAASQLVVGPMHGIHVTIDTVRSGTGQDVVGPHSNYKWAGWIAFVTDVGEVEQFQYLNFDAADYSPRSMAQASSVLVMLKQASQVTVTPWLLA